MLEGEENIIQGAKQGDSSCFSQLYDHYLPPIYRFIYLKVTHREEAEDLAHEVFLSAWQNLPRYHPQGFPFSSWLYKIARNKVIDHYRLKKPNVSMTMIDAELAGADASLELHLDEHLSLEEIQKAIRTLKPDQQDVLLMKFMADLPHSEISRIMGKSEGAVRIIQHRAIQAIRGLLNNK